MSEIITVLVGTGGPLEVKNPPDFISSFNLPVIAWKDSDGLHVEKMILVKVLHNLEISDIGCKINTDMICTIEGSFQKRGETTLFELDKVIGEVEDEELSKVLKESKNPLGPLKEVFYPFLSQEIEVLEEWRDWDDDCIDEVDNINELIENRLKSLASVEDWNKELHTEIELVLFGMYLDTVEAIDPDPSWFPVIKDPSGVWEFCVISYLSPYEGNIIILNIGCEWDEHGIEICIKNGNLISAIQAVYWGADIKDEENNSGYFSEDYISEKKSLIEEIPKRIKLIENWTKS